MGNPRGLLFHQAGNSLFVAEFSTKMDRDRVLDGSPWMVGKHAVLLKVSGPNIQPLQVEFKTLSVFGHVLWPCPMIDESQTRHGVC